MLCPVSSRVLEPSRRNRPHPNHLRYREPRPSMRHPDAITGTRKRFQLLQTFRLNPSCARPPTGSKHQIHERKAASPRTERSRTTKRMRLHLHVTAIITATRNRKAPVTPTPRPVPPPLRWTPGPPAVSGIDGHPPAGAWEEHPEPQSPEPQGLLIVTSRMHGNLPIRLLTAPSPLPPHWRPWAHATGPGSWPAQPPSASAWRPSTGASPPLQLRGGDAPPEWTQPPGPAQYQYVPFRTPAGMPPAAWSHAGPREEQYRHSQPPEDADEDTFRGRGPEEAPDRPEEADSPVYVEELNSTGTSTHHPLAQTQPLPSQSPPPSASPPLSPQQGSGGYHPYAGAGYPPPPPAMYTYEQQQMLDAFYRGYPPPLYDPYVGMAPMEPNPYRQQPPGDQPPYPPAYPDGGYPPDQPPRSPGQLAPMAAAPLAAAVTSAPASGPAGATGAAEANPPPSARQHVAEVPLAVSPARPAAPPVQRSPARAPADEAQEAQRRELKAEVERLGTRNEALQKQLAEAQRLLEAEKGASEGRAQQAAEERKQADMERQKAEETLNARLDAATADLAAAQQKLAQAAVEEANFKEKLARCADEIAHLRETHDEAEKTMQKKDAEIRNSGAAADRQLADVRKAQERISRIETDLANANREEYAKRCEDLDRTGRADKAALQRAIGENDALRGQIEKSQMVSAAHRLEANDPNSAPTHLDLALGAGQEALQAADQAQAQLRRRTEQLEEALKAAQREAADRTRDLDDRTRELDERTQEIGSLRVCPPLRRVLWPHLHTVGGHGACTHTKPQQRDVDDARGRMEDERRAADELQRKCADLEAQIRSRDDQADRLASDLRLAQDDAAHWEQAAHEAEGELRRAREDLGRLKDQHTRDVRELEGRLREVETTRERETRERETRERETRERETRERETRERETRERETRERERTSREREREAARERDARDRVREARDRDRDRDRDTSKTTDMDMDKEWRDLRPEGRGGESSGPIPRFDRQLTPPPQPPGAPPEWEPDHPPPPRPAVSSARPPPRPAPFATIATTPESRYIRSSLTASPPAAAAAAAAIDRLPPAGTRRGAPPPSYLQAGGAPDSPEAPVATVYAPRGASSDLPPPPPPEASGAPRVSPRGGDYQSDARTRVSPRERAALPKGPEMAAPRRGEPPPPADQPLARPGDGDGRLADPVGAHLAQRQAEQRAAAESASRKITQSTPFATEATLQERIATTAGIERELMTTQLELQNLDSELARMPHSAGSTIRGRQRRREIEERTEELKRLSAQFKMQLRQLNALK
ncbi:hypothetical protein PAPYR_7402 [Paratrimastix pyriformis]|uniref:Uncharacterized protein n=1 Tax=Paratrimastix pyriformis TaxID=342808 RepID=A0ABQ8UH75_9EUKA|nr:hypothetical protein PAPYR_7402 [Paratrimastix pyriformis]